MQILIAILLAAPLSGANVSWNGSGDGTSWSDKKNWSGNLLPTAADHVTIALDGTYAITGTSDHLAFEGTSASDSQS